MTVFLLTLIAGAVYESLCVYWVHHSERNQAWGIGWTTAVASLCTVTGVEGMINSPWGGAGYVLGCTTGAVAAVILKARLHIHEGGVNGERSVH
jgi:hypothetical protein